ncbi:hypothetical protein [Chlorella virus XW01]|nr:hypothetical protein [Chlorella virus XW01]
MEKFGQKYINTKLYMFALFLTLVGALNWGLIAIGTNLIEKLTELISSITKINQSTLDKIIYLIIALSAVYIGTRRDSWLPFLGYTVFPHSLVPLKEPKEVNHVVQVKVPPNSKVAYWGAIASNTIPDVLSAYNEFENSGVVMADENGNAKLKVVKGTGYIVPSGRYIPPHLHYRIVNESEGGMMGRIITHYY